MSQVTIGQQATSDVEFLGPALEIQRNDAADSTPIKENAQIAFATPAGATGNRDYVILYREKAGNSFAWNSLSSSRYQAEQGVVRGQAITTGVYALVVISTPTRAAGNTK